MFVSELEVLERATPEWYLAYDITKYCIAGFALLKLLLFFIPWR